MQIFTINGFPKSGKDTFVQMLREQGSLKIYHTSMINPVKQLLLRESVWNGEKTEKDRNLLSGIKDVLDSYNDFSYAKIKEDIRLKLSQDEDVFIVDAREPKDLQRFKDDYGAQSIFVIRDSHEVASNHADSDVLNFDYDFTIDNNGTLEDLELVAERFYNDVICK